MFKCASEPEVPADPVTDTALATWIVQLAGAGKDCRDQLTSAGAIVRSTDAN